MQEQKQVFEHWCVVELMGHQRIAGKVSEATLFGGTLMRVDVPDTERRKGFTKFYGTTAIYAITPVEEAIAKALANSFDQRPIEEWRLAHMLPAGNSESGEDDEYTDDQAF